MSSVLKPSLSPVSQNSSVPINKPMHPQQGPQTYGQPSNHLSGLNVPLNNPQIAHNHPAMAHQSNHYSLNVPNSSGHYMGGSQSIPASNHPVANAQPQQTYGSQKTVNYSAGFQPNLSNTSSQQNPIPPVSQPLMATNLHAHSEPQKEQPQSNGTSEEKSRVDENHVQTPKETSAVPTPLPASPEKKTENAKPVQEEKAPSQPVDKPLPQEPKSSPTKSVSSDSNDVESEDIKTPEPPTTEQNHKESTEETETEPEPSQETVESPEAKKASPETTPKEAKEEVKEDVEPASSPSKPSPATPRTSRKPKPKSEEESPKKAEKPSPKTPGTSKSKRARLRTQYYQSPLPELEIITKITASSSRRSNKNNDDKLIVFYKNEFLAVRNSEGGFYICQAVQNIYKSSGKIRIRWLSEDKNDKTSQIYTPDFYDNTDFDCILTNINLQRVEKGKFKLPPAEKERTYSILKRSLAAEKGEDITSPDLSEEHPDGLDISLYKDQEQIQKRAKKRKAKSPLKSPTRSKTPTKSPEKSKVAKVTPKPTKKSAPKKAQKAEKTLAAKKAVEEPAKKSISRTERAKRRSETIPTKVSPKVDHKKAKVLAKMARKSQPVAATSKAAPIKSSKSTPKVAPVQKAKVSAPASSKVSARKSKRSVKK